MAGSEAPALRKPPATATLIRLPLPRQSPTLLRCYSKAMYYAAMNSKSCRLTALGAHYWPPCQREQVLSFTWVRNI